MAFHLVQNGSTLALMTTAGVVSTLTLPTGVTIDSTKRPRFAIIGQEVVIANSPSVNLVFDPVANALRVLCPPPPASPMLVAVGASTGLTGTYITWYTFKIKDEWGRTLAESPLSPPSAGVALTADSLAGSGIATSSTPGVNARGIYRSVAGGSVPFPLFDMDDNVATSFDDNTSDVLLEAASADVLGLPPGSAPGEAASLCVAWDGRIWMVSTMPTKIDEVRASEIDRPWAFDTTIAAPPQGNDAVGVVALIPLRDELLVGKRNNFLRIVPVEGDDIPYDALKVGEGVGICAPDSAAVIRNVAYWLNEDGVYKFDSNGISDQPISRDKVHAWFTTDTYFNRELFPEAFGGWNPINDSYVLFLAAAGSTVFDRWVELVLSGPNKDKWLGPHKTGAFTPTCFGLMQSATGTYLPTMGSSSGYLYKMNQATRTDEPATAIDWEVIGKAHAADKPNMLRMWRRLAVINKIQASGTMTVTPYVGEMDASAGASISASLTVGRTVTRRLGPGTYCRLAFRVNTVATDVTLYGYELPWFDVGVRKG
jgi:hypothetical protein